MSTNINFYFDLECKNCKSKDVKVEIEPYNVHVECENCRNYFDYPIHRDDSIDEDY